MLGKVKEISLKCPRVRLESWFSWSEPRADNSSFWLLRPFLYATLRHRMARGRDLEHAQSDILLRYATLQGILTGECQLAYTQA